MLRVEPLSRQHRALLAGFQNRQNSLVEYLRRFALRHVEKDFLARTYVAIDEAAFGSRIAGYFSLSAASVERSSVAALPALDRLPRFPIPAVLLARLAVDDRVQGQGLGRYLFEEALGLTIELAGTGPLAFRLLVTDALDSDAAQFYEHFGLIRLADGFPCRMVLDLAPMLTRAR